MSAFGRVPAQEPQHALTIVAGAVGARVAGQTSSMLAVVRAALRQLGVRIEGPIARLARAALRAAPRNDAIGQPRLRHARPLESLIWINAAAPAQAQAGADLRDRTT